MKSRTPTSDRIVGVAWLRRYRSEYSILMFLASSEAKSVAIISLGHRLLSGSSPSTTLRTSPKFYLRLCGHKSRKLREVRPLHPIRILPFHSRCCHWDSPRRDSLATSHGASFSFRLKTSLLAPLALRRRAVSPYLFVQPSRLHSTVINSTEKYKY